MTRRELLKSVIPIPSEQPMRGERALDIAFDEMKYLRLNTEKALVMHMGTDCRRRSKLVYSCQRKNPFSGGYYGCREFGTLLLWLNNQIFRPVFFQRRIAMIYKGTFHESPLRCSARSDPTGILPVGWTISITRQCCRMISM